jgi:hypothetical protein
MRRVLARWQRSGLSLREFGEKRGIPLSTLSWWRQVFRRAGEAEVNSAAAETAVVFTEVPQPAKLPRTASFLEIVLRSGHTHEKVRADALDLAGQLDFPGRF